MFLPRVFHLHLEFPPQDLVRTWSVDQSPQQGPNIEACSPDDEDRLFLPLKMGNDPVGQLDIPRGIEGLIRIDRRTDRMIAEGFVEEVRRLLDMGYGESLKTMQSLGYSHLVSFLAGRQSLEEAVCLIKRDTRRYAKRQMTWFAADRDVVWLDPGDVEGAATRIGLFL